MKPDFAAAFHSAITGLPGLAAEFIVCGLLFFGLAVGLKGLPGAIRSLREAGAETRTNLILVAVDQFTTGPVLAVIGGLAGAAVKTLLPHSPMPGVWSLIGDVPTFLAVVFIGDFFGYWRHRIQHSAVLWPAHAIHHSDTRLTWFSLQRMHPIDQLGSMTDTVLLAALGFPPWALAANILVRHFYGYVIHTDAPWTYGKLGYVFNTPVMHRWHHARDIEGSGSNFATVFSVFDRAFGTYYQPGPCNQPLGVREDMGQGALGQYLHPFKVWTRALRGDRTALAAAPPIVAPIAPPMASIAEEGQLPA